MLFRSKSLNVKHIILLWVCCLALSVMSYKEMLVNCNLSNIVLVIKTMAQSLRKLIAEIVMEQVLQILFGKKCHLNYLIEGNWK